MSNSSQASYRAMTHKQDKFRKSYKVPVLQWEPAPVATGPGGAGVVTWQGLPCCGGVTGRRGVARRVGATWRVGGDGVLAWRGVAGRRWRGVGVAVSRRVTGCCAPCRGGVGVGGCWGVACRVEGALRVAGRCTPCWGGGVGWRGVGAGTNGGGMTCNVQGLACHVGVARRVGGGGVLGRGQDGGGLRARGGGNGLQRSGSCVPCWGGLAGWRWWRVASHVGAACWGGDKWRWFACTRGRQWPATFRLSRKKEKEKKNPYALGRSPAHPQPRPPSCVAVGVVIAPLWCTLATSICPRPNVPPPPTRRAAPTRHARPSAQCPFVPAPTPHQPTAPPQHGMQRPATRHAPSTRHATPQQPPTPTPPRHGAQHPVTRRLTATPTPCHRRPATSPQRGAQDPADPSRHADAQDPADPPRPFNATRNASATTDPHATPTRCATPRHPPTHRHANTPSPPTRHVAPTRRATPPPTRHGMPTRKTLPTRLALATTDPHATPTWRATPRHLPTHRLADPARAKTPP
ncbi:hypothetical protein EDB89DRAFT_2152044 [Lactarius sanguifluus]|nr:hypothetical protein EDB89DRAFT_2152044 [Lactarius sanguifluus]